MASKHEKVRIFCYGCLEYISPKEYLKSKDWSYEGTEMNPNPDGPDYDIVYNRETGEYRYTILGPDND